MSEVYFSGTVVGKRKRKIRYKKTAGNKPSRLVTNIKNRTSEWTSDCMNISESGSGQSND